MSTITHFTKTLGLVILAGGLTGLSFQPKTAGGSVRGTVTPPEAGLRAFLFSSRDTVSVNIESGKFYFPHVADGNYKLMVEATPPYRNGIKDGVRVTNGGQTDAGQVELIK